MSSKICLQDLEIYSTDIIFVRMIVIALGMMSNDMSRYFYDLKQLVSLILTQDLASLCPI